MTATDHPRSYQWLDPSFDEGEDGYKRLTVVSFEGIVVEALRELRDEKDAEINALRDEIAALRRLVEQMAAQRER